jgi:broad specificity phosphatase PhoE
MKVFVIRHGRAKHNDEGLWNDTPLEHMPLTPLGIEQTREAAERLKGFKPDVIFVSELQRTQETAAIINLHQAPIVVDRRINEQSAGGQVKTYKEFLDVIKQDRFNYRFEGGESYQDLKLRIHHFLDELRKKPYNIVFIVSHGDPIQMMNAYFHKLSDEETLLMRVKNCEILEFEF